MNELPMPGNSEAEEQVLACILSNPRAIVRVSELLKPEHFATPDYSEIYECMIALLHERRAPTTFNVADELLRRQMRGFDIKQVRWDLDQLAQSFALDTRLEDYAVSIIRASKSRRLIMALKVGIEGAYRQEEGSVESVLEAVSAIALDGDLRGMSSFADAVDRYLVELDERVRESREGRIIGVRTGFRDVDRMIGSLRPGTLNIIAARTSVGKTSWALSVGLNIAKQALVDGKGVGFFSLEMLEGEVVQRLLSMDSFLDNTLYRDGTLTPAEHEDVIARAHELRSIGFHLSDSAYRLDTIANQARGLCARKQVGLLIVDYLQLVDVPPSERGKQPRHELIGEVSKRLKRLAQDLHVPVLALAQLNREAERADAPQLHHIGDSDGIGRDADLVAFLHVSADEIAKRNRGEDYCVDFLVRKQRNGRLGQEHLWFRPRLTRFDDMDASEVNDGYL